MRRRWFVAVALVAGCHRPPLPATQVAGPVSDGLPVLQLQRVSATLENSPSTLYTQFVIGPTGTIVLYDNGRGDDSLYSVLDTTGRVVHRVGRVGDGPGEVRGGGLLGLGDSTFLLDQEGRLSEFALDGLLVATSVLRQEAFFHVAVSDSEALGTLPLRGGFFPVLASTSRDDVRQLVPVTDSFIDTDFPPGLTSGYPHIAVIGSRPDGFVLGDGWHYRLAFYAWDGSRRRILGRDLPPVHWSTRRIDRDVRQTITSLQAVRGRMSAADSARLYDETARSARPYFIHTGHLGLDGKGRTWVVGVDGDSGYADLFSADRFLGRLALPCPDFEGRWSVNGRWLALACAPADSSFAGDAVFHVYHLVEPASAARH